MLVCRSLILVCGLLLANGNFCLAQNPANSNSDYWKNSLTKRNRTAFRPLQETDRSDADDQLHDDLDAKLDDDLLEDDSDDRQSADVGFLWSEQPISMINIDPRNQLDNKPDDRSYMLVQQFPRGWHQLETARKNYRWQAPCISYQPLYFEDVALERYGQSRRGLQQSILSYAHFFKSAALLPWHMGVDPPYSCDYPLGYCRPGVCTAATRQKHFWR